MSNGQINLEKIISVHYLTLGKSEEEKKLLCSHFGIDYEEYLRRIAGKEKEAEFIYILESLNVLKHLYAFDENFSHITKEYTPDFTITMKNDEKFLLEVKSTHKDYFELSKNNLQNRITFAKNENLPLLFAISIKNHWGVFTTDFLKTNGKITLNNINSNANLLDYLFATCGYIIPKNTTIKFCYAKNHKKEMEIEHIDYGKLISYEILYNKIKVLRVKGKEIFKLRYPIYLQALEDIMSKKNITIKKEHSNITIITHTFIENTLINEYQFLLATLSHCKSNNFSYTPFISLTKEHYFLFPIVPLRKIINELVDNNLPIKILSYDTNNKIVPIDFKTYQKNYWYNNNEIQK